jgi:hypothetical protein
MAGAKSRIAIITAALAALMILMAPAFALELELANARIGDTPEEILASPYFGTPDGVFTPGNAFNSTKAMLGQVPPWAMAVQMDQIGAGQVEWVYNREPASIGIVMTGEGINAHVTDIVVSMWKTFGGSDMGQTSKGILLGSEFADMLERYGWPNRLQVIAEAGVTQTQQARTATGGARAAGALPLAGGVRLGGRRPTSAGTAAPRPGGGAFGAGPAQLGTSLAPRPAGGAGAGLRISLGGRRAIPTSAGPGPLPNVGGAAPATPMLRAAPAGPPNSLEAAVGQTAGMTFTRSCIASYPSVDFVVYRMRVFRIHVYGR